MTKAKRKYKNKVKRKYVDFYLCDLAIYEYSNNINFAKFVKEKLEEAIKNDKL